MANNLDKEAIRACPVCSGSRVRTLYRQRFSLPPSYGLPDAYDLVCCAACGFVYADTEASQKDYDRYYRELSRYEDAAVASGGGDARWDADRLEAVAQEIAAQMPARESSIIDIGCANGGLLAALKRSGYRDLTGLDPSAACTARIREEFGIDAFTGGIFDRSVDGLDLDKKFDLVILSHVLEHIRDLHAAIEMTLTRLKPGGMLYLETPDAERYADLFVVPYYYFDCEHINHFSQESLGKLAAGFGMACRHAGQRSIRIGWHDYPVVYGFYRKGGAGVPEPGGGVAAAGVEDGRENHIRRSIERYLELSAGAETSPELASLAKSGDEIVVWGAGSYASRLLKESILADCRIAAFIDSDSRKQGARLGGIEVHSPDFLHGSRATVVICSALHAEEIAAGIRAMGISNRIIKL